MEDGLGSESPKKVLAKAIAIERTNARRYEEWSARFAAYDAEVSDLLYRLYQEELIHDRMLTEMHVHLFGDSPQALSGEASALNVMDPQDEHFLIIDEQSARKILSAALAAELDSTTYYRCAMKETDNPDLRQIYKTLGEFEDEHVDKIKSYIVGYLRQKADSQ